MLFFIFSTFDYQIPEMIVSELIIEQAERSPRAASTPEPACTAWNRTVKAGVWTWYGLTNHLRFLPKRKVICDEPAKHKTKKKPHVFRMCMDLLPV